MFDKAISCSLGTSPADRRKDRSGLFASARLTAFRSFQCRSKGRFVLNPTRMLFEPGLFLHGPSRQPRCNQDHPCHRGRKSILVRAKLLDYVLPVIIHIMPRCFSLPTVNLSRSWSISNQPDRKATSLRTKRTLAVPHRGSPLRVPRP